MEDLFRQDIAGAVSALQVLCMHIVKRPQPTGLPTQCRHQAEIRSGRPATPQQPNGATASLRYLSLTRLCLERRERARMRPPPLRIHRRKPVSEVSLPESCQSSSSTRCPERSFAFLQAGHSAKSRFWELEFYEPAIGDLTLPANCYRSALHLNFGEYSQQSRWQMLGR